MCIIVRIWLKCCAEHVIHLIFYQYSFIAAVGLVEDNAVVLVASMLVSPLMVYLYIYFPVLLKIYCAIKISVLC